MIALIILTVLTRRGARGEQEDGPGRRGLRRRPSPGRAAPGARLGRGRGAGLAEPGLAAPGPGGGPRLGWLHGSRDPAPAGRGAGAAGAVGRPARDRRGGAMTRPTRASDPDDGGDPMTPRERDPVPGGARRAEARPW